MNKTYLYPRFDLLRLIVLVPIAIALAIVAWGYFAEAARASNLIAKIVTAFIGLFFAFGSVWILAILISNFAGLRKIIADNDTITVQNLFSSRTIAWGNITEFGTDTVGFSYPVRRFYLKAADHGDETIYLCTSYLENLKDMIDPIFTRAVNARFVIVENVARIPFTKRLQLVPWDRNDHSFL